jgi:hypothetical protein
LVGQRRTAARAIEGQLCLMLLDQVLDLSARAIDGCIDVLPIAVFDRRNGVAYVEASSQHVVLVARACLDPRHNTALLVP